MLKKIAIVEAPSNLGLKQLTPERIPGVDKLPGWLQEHGFYTLVDPAEVLQVLPAPFGAAIDPESGVRNAPEIIDHAKRLAAAVERTVKSQQFALVIGGDCSILIGCAAGLRAGGKYGLCFMDGHTDFMPVTLSHTKAAAGMDLALVTGNGAEKLVNINGIGPYFNEEHVTAFGNRYLDREYVEVIERSRVNYFDLHKLRETSITAITGHFLAGVAAAGLDGFWIHFDADVLANEIMPCVDSPQPGGLSYQELEQTLMPLLESPLVAGMSLTILDPGLDPDGKYTAEFVRVLGNIMSTC